MSAFTGVVGVANVYAGWFLTYIFRTKEQERMVMHSRLLGPRAEDPLLE